MTSLIWGIIAVVAFVIEISSAALLSIWFAIGAIVALFLSLLKLPIWLQIMAFVIVSLVLFVFSWKKIIKVKPEKINQSSLIGKRATVVEPINYSQNKGRVKVGDQYWTAISKNKEKTFKVNSIVVVIDAMNTTLIVDEPTEVFYKEIPYTEC